MSPRRPLRLAAAAASLALALSGPVPGHATDGSGCPLGDTTWTSGRSCVFLVKGTPIVFRGTVTTWTGSPSIHVWISPKGSPEVVLAECFGTTGCQGGIPNSTTFLDVLPPGAEKPALDCNVRGTGKGTFYCQSGTNN